MLTRRDSSRALVGLIPCAGRGQRWRGELGFSKELLPIDVPDGETKQPVIAYLIDAFRLGGIERAFVVTRSEKLDIPAALRDGEVFGCDLAYVVIQSSPNMPSSVAAAAAFLTPYDVVIGFPDVVFEPRDAVRALVSAWKRGGADVTLALFGIDDPIAAETVDLDAQGFVRRITVKEPSASREAWLLAAWGPRFTRFLVEFVDDPGRSERSGELHLGHVLQGAIDRGLTVTGVRIPGGRFHDTGSPEKADSVRDFWSRS